MNETFAAERDSLLEDVFPEESEKDTDSDTTTSCKILDNQHTQYIVHFLLG